MLLPWKDAIHFTNIFFMQFSAFQRLLELKSTFLMKNKNATGQHESY